MVFLFHQGKLGIATWKGRRCSCFVYCLVCMVRLDEWVAWHTYRASTVCSWSLTPSILQVGPTVEWRCLSISVPVVPARFCLAERDMAHLCMMCRRCGARRGWQACTAGDDRPHGIVRDLPTAGVLSMPPVRKTQKKNAKHALKRFFESGVWLSRA